MESLRNEPVYFGGSPTNGTTTPTVIATNGQNDLLSTVVLASLLGRNNGLLGGDNSTASVLTTITKSEGDIKEAVNATAHRNQIENAAHFSNLNNRLCDSEKEAIKAGYEARLESLQTKADLLANQNSNTMSIKDDIKDFRFATDKQFCETNVNINSKFCDLNYKLENRFGDVERAIDKGFDKMLEREYKEEIRSLRDKLDQIRYKESSKDISEIKHDVDRIICGLSKVPNPTSAIPSVLDGCCG